MLAQLKSIIKKESLDALRDGKSLATAFLMPVIFTAVTVGMLHFVVALEEGTHDFTVAVANQQRAQPLMDWLEENGLTVVEAPENPSQAVLSQQYDIILEIPENFNESFRAQKSAQINLLSDHSRTESQAKTGKLKHLIHRWSSETGALRLISRNVSPSIANPISVNDVNVTSDQRAAAKVLSALPMFFVMIAFAAGIGMASDMAAGERERKSLEPLLINPARHSTIFIGKLLSVFLVTVVITLIGVTMQFYGVSIAPLAELGIKVSLGLSEFVYIILLLLPIALLAGALQLLVSFFSRSFKDAQTYNGFVILIPMLPGMYLTFNSGSAELWQMFVPVLGAQALFVDIISGDSIEIGYALMASATSVALSALLTIVGIQLLKQEKTLFS